MQGKARCQQDAFIIFVLALLRPMAKKQADPTYSAYLQSFSFRCVVVPERLLDEKFIACNQQLA